MKVIDLLNKIANEEIVPEKIEFDNKIYDYVTMWQQYVDDKEKPLLKYISEFNYSGLNDEVNVVEEEQYIDIQSIEEVDEEEAYTNIDLTTRWTRAEDILVKKLNEAIRAIKQLDRQINNK